MSHLYQRVIVAALLAMTVSIPPVAVEIPLDSVTPVRIGFVDLQKVFDTYPEKAFAEGDLLKEIQKRRGEMGARQNSVNTMRRQLTADRAALEQAKAGRAVIVPVDEVAALTPTAAPAPPPPAEPEVSTTTRAKAAAEPYPTEEPLAGLPGHDGGAAEAEVKKDKTLPGMQAVDPKSGSSSVLDSLAASGAAATLTPEAQTALQKRIEANQLALDRSIYQFKDYRGKALEDMKHLQTEKTYGVMARIYAVLQGLARDESITVVVDKAYVLYGEDAVDLSEKLIARLNQEQL